MSQAMASHHHDETDGVVVSHPTEEPEVLDADEPRTPGWMPLLGGVLFLSAAIFFVATQPPGKTTEELQRAAQAAAEEAKAKAAPPPAPAPAPAPMPAPGGAQPMPKGG
ncbi:MAG: hypothetical protein DYH12_02775 [Sorangiineae bacterium PRO1]|nr:hypothetical protein [Sorangiineae bacterium PRO1]